MPQAAEISPQHAGRRPVPSGTKLAWAPEELFAGFDRGPLPSGPSGESSDVRGTLIRALFEVLDVDSDGRLSCAEMRAFATETGFTGSDEDWSEEYATLCADGGQTGVDLALFAQLVNDRSEVGCFCEDDELRAVLDKLSPFWTAQELSQPPRWRLVSAVFELCDRGGDGWLDKHEMHRFARLTGFDGSDEAWSEEFVRLCAEVASNPRRGLRLEHFASLVNDRSERGCYCSDQELYEMLQEDDEDLHEADYQAPAEGEQLPSPLPLVLNSSRGAPTTPAQALSRGLLVRAIFHLCDLDGDGLLNEQELYSFAVQTGFQGNPGDWAEEFRLICSERCADRGGVDVTLLEALINDESSSGCFCSDEELWMIRRNLEAAPRLAQPQQVELGNESLNLVAATPVSEQVRSAGAAAGQATSRSLRSADLEAVRSLYRDLSSPVRDDGGDAADAPPPTRSSPQHRATTPFVGAAPPPRSTPQYRAAMPAAGSPVRTVEGVAPLSHRSSPQHRAATSVAESPVRSDEGAAALSHCQTPHRAATSVAGSPVRQDAAAALSHRSSPQHRTITPVASSPTRDGEGGFGSIINAGGGNMAALPTRSSPQHHSAASSSGSPVREGVAVPSPPRSSPQCRSTVPSASGSPVRDGEGAARSPPYYLSASGIISPVRGGEGGAARSPPYYLSASGNGSPVRGGEGGEAPQIHLEAAAGGAGAFHLSPPPSTAAAAAAPPAVATPGVPPRRGSSSAAGSQSPPPPDAMEVEEAEAAVAVQRAEELARRELVWGLFTLLDSDQDNHLQVQELWVFARATGFDRGAAEWTEEFELLCEELAVPDPARGMSFQDFHGLVNDASERGFFCSTDELEDMLTRLRDALQEQPDEEAGGSSTAEAPELSTPRRALIGSVFSLHDLDGDGALDESEMLSFARHTGFAGEREVWSQEFRLLCQENGAEPSVGIDLPLFARLVNDRSGHGCYCSEEELHEILQHNQARPVVRRGDAQPLRTAGGGGNAALHLEATQLLLETPRSKLPQGLPSPPASLKSVGGGGGNGPLQLLMRSELISRVFQACDADRDGALNEREMGVFARSVGFDGDDEEWAGEYGSLCSDNKTSPLLGVDANLFTRIVNDLSDAGLYCSDEELRTMLARLKPQALLPGDLAIVKGAPALEYVA